MTLRASGLTCGPIQSLDLDLQAGLTVVTGEPECGTSTLLRLLAGEQDPDHGAVERTTVAYLSTPPGHEWTDHEVATRALGAPHLVGREMWAMSGGERQRVRLANLLAQDADVLLLDEPLGLLDEVGRRAVVEALKADGRPVLVAIKSDAAILGAADRVLTLVDGRLT